MNEKDKIQTYIQSLPPELKTLIAQSKKTFKSAMDIDRFLSHAWNTADPVQRFTPPE